jgi:AcrR family transcriptional regulator
MLSARSMSTRQALIDAAEREFAEHGYAAVGIRELAAAAGGANVSALQYHFGSKQELYLAAIRNALTQPDLERTWGLLAAPPRNRLDAARQLVAFVRAFLGRLLDEGELQSCARLMLREAMRPGEACDLVVRDFVAPHEELVAGVVRVLAPGLSPEQELAHARSVLGQVLHYHVFRPFIERRSPSSVLTREDVGAIADHVARFSLGGLSCSPAFIEKALAHDPAQPETTS